MGLRRFVSPLMPDAVLSGYRRLRYAIGRWLYEPRRFWTRCGRTYMQCFPPTGSRSEGIIIGVLRELEVNSLLDVGCGYGRYLKAVRQELALARLAGVDISPTQIAQAREYLRDFPDVELRLASATNLPFAAQSFDAILTYGLMIHLRERETERFLEEARRVGRHWGLFLESSNNAERPYLNPAYYFAHDYRTLFARHGLHLEREILIEARTHEYLYVVRLAPGASA